MASQQRKIHDFTREFSVLFDYLKGLDDLVIIAMNDLTEQALRLQRSLKELSPAVTVGLTASLQI